MAALAAAAGGGGGALQDAIREHGIWLGGKGEKSEEEISAAVHTVLGKLQAWTMETFRKDTKTNMWPQTAISALNSVVEVLQRTGTESGNAQQIYFYCFVLWILSLKDPQDSLAAFLQAGAIGVLTDLVAAAPSRKVTRVSVSTLRNLAEAKNSGNALLEMYSKGLDRLIGTMVSSNAYKQANDAEFEADVTSLATILQTNFRELSTFERWSNEVGSGKLKWGIVHTESFWRENSKFVDHNSFDLLRKLIALLNSQDTLTVTIALYDLGEFVRFFPNGRLVCIDFGGKKKALELIESPDADIRRQALQCASKIMISNWDHLAR